MFSTSLTDVYLSNFDFGNGQKEIESLTGNENLYEKYFFKFSKKYKEEKIDALENKGFKIKEIKINFIVYWKNKDMEKEIKIILPSVMFER